MAKGRFADAETLFQQYLQIFPDDTAVQIKFADTILKVSASPSRQGAVLQIYDGILKQDQRAQRRATVAGEVEDRHEAVHERPRKREWC